MGIFSGSYTLAFDVECRNEWKGNHEPLNRERLQIIELGKMLLMNEKGK
jgi:hypothetical protein